MMHRGQKTAVSNLATNMLLTKTVLKIGLFFIAKKNQNSDLLLVKSTINI